MTLLDLVLLAAVLAVGLRALWGGMGPRLRWGACALLLALAALQAIREGFIWQTLGSAPLVAAIAVPALWPARTWGRPLLWLGRLALLGLTALAMGPWMAPPVPRLPAPRGPYAVGTEIFRWVDAARPEAATDDPSDRRNVVVQAWYPAAGPTADGPRAPYLDGVGALPKMVSVLPGFIMRHYDRIDSHARFQAPVDGRRPAWPVVVFSPGYGAARAFYTALATGLASRGYVVLALDHPYEAAVTQLADGRVVGPIERFIPGDRNRIGYMIKQQEVRAADVGFVLDQLARPGVLGPRLSGRLDLGHIAVIGHSFGGATAIAALERDARVKAAVNIDGTPYGPLADHVLTRPFMLIESDYAEVRHGDIYLTGNGRLLARDQAQAWRFEILRANHFSFTDAMLLFAPPARLATAHVMGGARGPLDTQAATIDILDAFLSGPLKGAPGDPAAAAARYPAIVGGPVAPSRTAMAAARPAA